MTTPKGDYKYSLVFILTPVIAAFLTKTFVKDKGEKILLWMAGFVFIVNYLTETFVVIPYTRKKGGCKNEAYSDVVKLGAVPSLAPAILGALAPIILYALTEGAKFDPETAPLADMEEKNVSVFQPIILAAFLGVIAAIIVNARINRESCK